MSVFGYHVCKDCGHYFYGQSYKPCPSCSSEDREQEPEKEEDADEHVR